MKEYFCAVDEELKDCSWGGKEHIGTLGLICDPNVQETEAVSKCEFLASVKAEIKSNICNITTLPVVSNTVPGDKNVDNNSGGDDGNINPGTESNDKSSAFFIKVMKDLEWTKN